MRYNHLKVCDLDLTFYGHPRSKCKLKNQIYDFVYVPQINIDHSMHCFRYIGPNRNMKSLSTINMLYLVNVAWTKKMNF